MVLKLHWGQVVVQTVNPITQETEAERTLWVWGLPVLKSKNKRDYIEEGEEESLPFINTIEYKYYYREREYKLNNCKASGWFLKIRREGLAKGISS